jgi:hypothetical protein
VTRLPPSIPAKTKWWVGGSEAKKVTGPVVLRFFLDGVIELPLPRNAQKHDQSKPRKMGIGFLSFFG